MGYCHVNKNDGCTNIKKFNNFLENPHEVFKHYYIKNHHSRKLYMDKTQRENVITFLFEYSKHFYISDEIRVTFLLFLFLKFPLRLMNCL